VSPEIVLLVLRLLAALVLYAFLGLILAGLARDSRLAGGRTVSVPAAALRLEGDETGLLFRLAEVNSLGRAADNNIHLTFERVSAHHARLGYQGGQWWVEDLGSTNGTKVNDIPVEQPLVVTYGDRIVIGDVSLILERGDVVAGRATATL